MNSKTSNQSAQQKVIIAIDMDNTLVLTNALHVHAFNYAFVKSKLDEVKPKVIERLLGLHGEEIIKRIFPRLSKQKVKKILMLHNNFVARNAAKLVKRIAKPNTINALIKKLKQKYYVVLTTNASKKEVNAILKASGINKKLFDAIITKEMAKPKPSADALKKAEHLLNAKVAIVIGDTPYDILAGKKVKAKTIAVLTGNFSFKELIKYKPDMVLHNITELAGII